MFSFAWSESQPIKKLTQINIIELGFLDDPQIEFPISNKDNLNSTVKAIIDLNIAMKVVEKSR